MRSVGRETSTRIIYKKGNLLVVPVVAEKKRINKYINYLKEPHRNTFCKQFFKQHADIYQSTDDAS